MLPITFDESFDKVKALADKFENSLKHFMFPDDKGYRYIRKNIII